MRDDKVGPAEYQIEVKKTTRGPTKWHKEEEPTQLQQQVKKQKDGLQPGPGHYKPALASQQNLLYQKNRSSVFASAVPRASTFGTASDVSEQRIKMLQSGQVQQPIKDRHKRFVPVEGKYKAIA